MFFKTTILVLLMMQWKFQDILAEAQDIDSKLTELSNDIKQLAKQFEKNSKTTEDTMLELRGEENFQLSILTGQQRALENKMDVVRNNQDDLNQALSQLKKNQDELKQELSQLRPNQNVMMQGQSHMTQTQDEMKKGLSEVKLTQDKMKQALSQIKLTQNEMKQGQSHMKQAQEEIKQAQSQTKQTQDEYKIKINFIFNEIKKLPCKLALPSLQTQIFNNKRYYFSYDQPMMSWPEADKFCKSHGMDLVSVETQQEWDGLKPEVGKLYSKITIIWSSGSDAAQEGKWKWTSTGADVTFLAGFNGMNNATNENCLFLYTAGWGDFPCSGKLPFICEQNTLC